MAGNINIGGPILGTSTYIDGQKVQQNVKFDLPEVAYKTAEIQAMGTHEVPLKGFFEAMEHKVYFDRTDALVLSAYRPGKVEIRHHWVQDEFDPNGDEVEADYKAIIVGICKTAYPTGTIETGETPEIELARTVNSIAIYRSGVELLCIDRFSQTYRFNGKDYYRDIDQYL